MRLFFPMQKKLSSNNSHSGIYCIDAGYYKPQLASIHLIHSQGRIAIVDTGTNYSIPEVSTLLTQLGLNYLHVDYIILTHIHLDHAGGASKLMRLCKNAQLVVHPKGARHMHDPTKLIEGTKAVYGEQAYKKLYGDINSIELTRIIQSEDEQNLNLADRPLSLIHTPGHADHHHCIVDHHSNSVFTGDTLGVSYSALRNESHSFVMPTTTPVQFNPLALHKSIDKVMSYQPQTLYLTHYSALIPSSRIIAGLHEQIDDFVMLTDKAADSGNNLLSTLEHDITEYLVRRCLNEIDSISETTAREWITLDARLNAQGLVYWHENRR